MKIKTKCKNSRISTYVQLLRVTPLYFEIISTLGDLITCLVKNALIDAYRIWIDSKTEG